MSPPFLERLLPPRVFRVPAKTDNDLYSAVRRFKRHEDAMTAIEKMNNFQLAGREVRYMD